MCWYDLECLLCMQNSLIHTYIDVNECALYPTICGLGTCSVTSDGLYQCTCQDGAMITGSNTDGSLICIGIYYAL